MSLHKTYHRTFRSIPFAFIFCILAVLTPAVHSQGIMRYATSVEGIEADKIAIYIENLRTGEVVLDVNGEEPMIPASTTKLFTAATVFQNCDLDSRYATEILTTGKLHKGVLKGNIIIKASGDPTIGSSHFTECGSLPDSIVAAIIRQGIKTIEGRIIIDNPKWLDQDVPSGWTNDDINYPYGTGHHPFNFADNRFTLRFSRDSSYTLSPENPSVTIKKTSSNAGGTVWRKRNDVIYNVCYNKKTPLVVDLANPSPAGSFIAVLQNKLTESGIIVEEKDIKKKSHDHVIYTHYSPTIYDILRSLVLRSDNMMAEAALRYAYPGKDREKAAKEEVKLWNKLGVDTRDIVIEDGSGLSRNNRITAYVMADMLAWMCDNDENFVRFLNMLPKAGVSGTLKSFLKGTPLQGRLWAKTGSLNGVQCYAGYAVDAVGVPTHIVVIMVNGFKGSRAEVKTVLQNLLIEKLCVNL